VKSFLAGQDQRDFAAALDGLLARRGEAGTVDASPELWRALAELGLLGLGSPAMGGTALDVAVAGRALGAQLCPGPVLAALAGGALLVGDQLEGVVAGSLRPTFTDGLRVPWADSAGLVIEFDGPTAWLVDGSGSEGRETGLSGETWGIGHGERVTALGAAGRAVALFNLALSGYLLGVARRMIDQGAQHAATRTQFGQPIGSFQAVAHPLANAEAEVGATWALAQLVSAEIEHEIGSNLPDRSWQLRAAATRAGLIAAQAVHQAMGAMGFASETGVGQASAQLRQWSLLPPTRPSPLDSTGSILDEAS
jgi:alkylation response protein AidB-like acyl-CoA dehydrogenase